MSALGFLSFLAFIAVGVIGLFLAATENDNDNWPPGGAA